MNKLQKIINGRPVCMLVHGKSIVELEQYIHLLKDKDICWASTGVFPMMEEFILSSIGKKLDIVFDCATVAPHLFKDYEFGVRLPRIDEFLSREENNLWCTSFGIIRDTIRPLVPIWETKYADKIQLIDNLVHPDVIPRFMDAPNSATLMIGTLLGGGASKIIVFGLDGYNGPVACPPEEYYHPELIVEERKLAIGNINDENINRDTNNLLKLFPEKLMMYREFFGNNAEVINCSSRTIYDFLPKIKYEQLLENV